MRRNYRAVPLLAAFFILAFFPFTSAEAVFKESEGVVSVSQNDVIDDNLFVIADALYVSGEVRGDVIVAASKVEIKGNVTGDIILFASDAVVEGTVGGDVRALSGSLRMNAVTAGNATIATGNLVVGDAGEIGHSLTAFAENLELNGRVVKNVTAFSEHARINAPVGGTVFLYLNGSGILTLGEKGRIGGDLHYLSKSELLREDGSEIAGIVRRIEPTPKGVGNGTKLFFLLSLIYIISIFVVGLFIVNLFGMELSSTAREMLKRPLLLLAKGFAYFFLTPLALLLLLLTVIGIPLAFIAGAFFFALLIVTQAVSAFAAGFFIFEKLSPQKSPHPVLVLLIGLLAVRVLTGLPYLGWFFGFLFLWWALGALMERVVALLRKQPSSEE